MEGEYKNQFFGLLLTGVLCIWIFIVQKSMLMSMARFDPVVFNCIEMSLPISYVIYMLLYYLLKAVLQQPMAIGLSVALSVYCSAILAPLLLSGVDPDSINGTTWTVIYVVVSLIIATVYRRQEDVLSHVQHFCINSLMIVTIVACMVFDWFACRDLYHTAIPVVSIVVAVMVCAVIMMFVGAGKPAATASSRGLTGDMITVLLYKVPFWIGDRLFPYTSNVNRFDVVRFQWGQFLFLSMMAAVLVSH